MDAPSSLHYLWATLKLLPGCAVTQGEETVMCLQRYYTER